MEKDIDFQTSTEEIYLKFHSADPLIGSAALVYSVGVGSSPGLDDVQSFSHIQMTDVITVVGLSMDLYTVRSD